MRADRSCIVHITLAEQSNILTNRSQHASAPHSRPKATASLFYFASVVFTGCVDVGQELHQRSLQVQKHGDHAVLAGLLLQLDES